MTQTNITKGFVLCAGMGSRMRPYTDDKPKPMVELGGKPLIGHILSHMQSAGITQTGVNVHYKPDVLERYLRAHHPETFISHETELLETGGGIKKALPYFNGEDFMIINGDAFWVNAPEIDTLTQLQNAWNPQKMDILLVLQDIASMPITEAIGDYDLDAQGRAARSSDKTGHYMFTSLRINKSSIFDNCPDGPFNYRDLMDKAQEQGRLYGIINKGTWYHISTPEDLDAVNKALFNTVENQEQKAS